MSKKAEPKVYTQVDWPVFAGEPIVKYIHGLPYTAAMLLRRQARLVAQSMKNEYTTNTAQA